MFQLGTAPSGEVLGRYPRLGLDGMVTSREVFQRGDGRWVIRWTHEDSGLSEDEVLRLWRTEHGAGFRTESGEAIVPAYRLPIPGKDKMTDLTPEGWVKTWARVSTLGDERWER